MAVRLDPPPRATLRAGLDEGALTTNYFGHGSQDFWADEKLFTAEDAALLAPNGRETVLFAWTPFRATSWGGTLAMLSGQIGLNGFAISDQMILVMRPLLIVWMGVAFVIVDAKD